MDILDLLIREFPIDTQRLYLSGLSMGGYGAWDLTLRYPMRFAAVVPVCGAGDPGQAAIIANVPVWAFHSADDPVVPVSGSRGMVEALQDCGGNISYTEYQTGEGVGHAAWTPAGKSPLLIDWILSQRLSLGAAPVVGIKGFAAPISSPSRVKNDRPGK